MTPEQLTAIRQHPRAEDVPDLLAYIERLEQQLAKYESRSPDGDGHCISERVVNGSEVGRGSQPIAHGPTLENPATDQSRAAGSEPAYSHSALRSSLSSLVETWRERSARMDHTDFDQAADELSRLLTGEP